ncbi:MAG: 3-dehydroquinate synthase [Phycisphaeraceae bacterium]|nr:3-dehydroquinate synthase [Phycisphaeraceae bacterium]
MPTVELKLPGKDHGYEILIEPGAIDALGERLAQIAPHAKAAAILDENIESSHGRVALRALKRGGYDVTVGVMPASEKMKSLKTVQDLLAVLLDAKLERKSPVVAIGGGIIGDTAGYVAASYLRGVPFVQVPTTLLSMVDASVGGKVGVNVKQGKNLIGAFHQPVLVCIDTDVLKTLPDRELRCGLAECVKHGVIRDPDLFAWIEDNVQRILDLESDALVELVKRNVEIKAAVVTEDEKEQGVRAHLNFGHTFAHAIEASPQAQAEADEPKRRRFAPPQRFETPKPKPESHAYEGPYAHGEAVSLGMVAATSLAVSAGRCDGALLDRLVALLDRIGLPTSSDKLADTDLLMGIMQTDKKVKDGHVRLVLPDRMGAVSVVNDTPADAIAAAWDAIRA